jgi:hypothetical protein
MLILDQDKFITDFVTTYLATAAAQRDMTPQGGQPVNPQHPPVQNAVMAARIAWVHLLQYGYGPRQNLLTEKPQAPAAVSDHSSIPYWQDFNC